jgi:hypothetical protein
VELTGKTFKVQQRPQDAYELGELEKARQRYELLQAKSAHRQPPTDTKQFNKYRAVKDI